MRYPGLPDSVVAELNRQQLTWEVKTKTKHLAILVAGKIVLYFGGSLPGPRDERNMVASVRRFARGVEINKYRKVS